MYFKLRVKGRDTHEHQCNHKDQRQEHPGEHPVGVTYIPYVTTYVLFNHYTVFIEIEMFIIANYTTYLLITYVAVIRLCVWENNVLCCIWWDFGYPSIFCLVICLDWQVINFFTHLSCDEWWKYTYIWCHESIQFLVCTVTCSNTFSLLLLGCTVRCDLSKLVKV